MSFLIAVVTCHQEKFKARADVARRTWVPRAAGLFDVKFFLGSGGEGEPREDEVWLDCPDDYKNLRLKTQHVFRWAADHAYSFVFKTDDDVYIIPERLNKSFMARDYSGRVRGPSQENEAPKIYGRGETNFCSGFGYWLSQNAARVVAEAPDNGDWAEDRFTGNILAKAGIRPVHDDTMLLWPPLQGHICHNSNQRCGACVQQYAHVSVLCPYARPEVIEQLHNEYLRTGGFIPTWMV